VALKEAVCRDLNLLWQPGVQDTGFGKALLDEYGLEVALRINRPAKVGEPLSLRCSEASTVTSEVSSKRYFAPKQSSVSVQSCRGRGFGGGGILPASYLATVSTEPQTMAFVRHRGTLV